MIRPLLVIGIVGTATVVVFVSLLLHDSELPDPTRQPSAAPSKALPTNASSEIAPDVRSDPAQLKTLTVSEFPPPTPEDLSAIVVEPPVPKVNTGFEWSAEAVHHSDARVRRQALEDWARNPRKSLDLVSEMMVDPDETIRDRAQQIFEDALARR